jgi:hypothetical protein
MRRLSSVILTSMFAFAACDGDSSSTTTPAADVSDDGPLFSDVSGGGNTGTTDTSSGGGGNTGATDTSSGGGGNTGANDTSSGGGGNTGTDTSSGGGNTGGGGTDTSSGGGGGTNPNGTICPTINTCVKQCPQGDQTCAENCFTSAASDEEANAAFELLNCEMDCNNSATSAETFFSCLSQNCADERIICARGPDASSSASGACSGLNSCLNACGASGTPACRRACYAAASPSSTDAFLDISMCAAEACSDVPPSSREACYNASVASGGECYSVYTACVGTSGGGTGGGGTTDPNDKGEGLCQGIVSCYTQCTDSNCGNACFTARDSDAEATSASTYLNCPFENSCFAWFGARCTNTSECPSGWTCTAATNGICRRTAAPTDAEREQAAACTSANCTDEWVSCIQGPTGGSGACSAIRPCLTQCPAGNFTCRRACYKAVSTAAVTAYVDHRECVEAECGDLQSDSDYYACDDRVSGAGGVCATQYNACYPSGAGASAGGAGGFGGAWFDGPRFRDTERFRHYENDFFAP